MPHQPDSTERHPTELPTHGDQKSDEAVSKLERRLAAMEAKEALRGAAAAVSPPVETAQPPRTRPADPAEIALRQAKRMTAIEAAIQTEQRDVA